MVCPDHCPGAAYITLKYQINGGVLSNRGSAKLRKVINGGWVKMSEGCRTLRNAFKDNIAMERAKTGCQKA